MSNAVKNEYDNLNQITVKLPSRIDLQLHLKFFLTSFHASKNRFITLYQI